MPFPVIGSIRSFSDVKAALDLIRNWFNSAFFGDATGPTGAIDSDLVEFAGTSGKYFKDGGLSHNDMADAKAKKHNRLHALDSTLDHSSTIASGDIMKADNHGLPTGGGTFTDLADVPNSYVGQSGKVPRVKNTEDGLEFVDLGGI